MSSINAVNPGVGDLLQTFSRNGSTFPSALSSASVQSALERASPGDLVQLSAQALQLQQDAGLFAGSDSPQSGTDPLNALFQSLANPSQDDASGTSTAIPTGSITPAVANAASETLAQQEAATLFGDTSNLSTGNSTISLLG